METLLGLFIAYSWVHALAILSKGKEFEKNTGYEKFIVIFGGSTLILVIIGLFS